MAPPALVLISMSCGPCGVMWKSYPMNTPSGPWSAWAIALAPGSTCCAQAGRDKVRSIAATAVCTACTVACEANTAVLENRCGWVTARVLATSRSPTSRPSSCSNWAGSSVWQWQPWFSASARVVVGSVRNMGAPKGGLQTTLIHQLHQLLSAFFAFAIPVHEVGRGVAGEQGELHQLLHHIDHTVKVGGWFHAVVIAELQEGLGHRTLVGDGEHAHPAAQHTHLVHGVKALRAAAHLHHRQRLALGGPHGAAVEWNPVDLRFHDAGHGAMPLGRGPDHAFTPLRQLAQFLHLGGGVGRVIGQGQ